MSELAPYPEWICAHCGEKYGSYPKDHTSTWHPDICGWCGQQDAVTEPRDFQHPPRPDLIKHIERAMLAKAMALFTKDETYTGHVVLHRLEKLRGKRGAPINWANDPNAVVEDDEPQIGRDYV